MASKKQKALYVVISLPIIVAVVFFCLFAGWRIRFIFRMCAAFVLALAFGCLLVTVVRPPEKSVDQKPKRGKRTREPEKNITEEKRRKPVAAVIILLIVTSFFLYAGIVFASDIPYFLHPPEIVLKDVSVYRVSSAKSLSYEIKGTDENGRPRTYSIESETYEKVRKELADEKDMKAVITYLPHSKITCSVELEGN